MTFLCKSLLRNEANDSTYHLLVQQCVCVCLCVCVEEKLRTVPNGHCSEQLSIQLENHSSNVKRLHSTVVCFGVELIFLATRFVSCNVFEKISLSVIFI